MPPRLPDVAATLESGAGGSGVISANANGGVAMEETAMGQPVALRATRGPRLSFLGGGSGGAGTHRKWDSVHLQNGENTIAESRHSSTAGGEGDSVSEHSRARSRDNPNRRSFFRSTSDKTPPLPQYGGPETVIRGGVDGGAKGASRTTRSGSGSASNGASNGAKSKLNGATEWVAELGLRKSMDVGSSERKKSSASDNWMGEGSDADTGGGGGGIVKMGSVRKRLSMLKLGKKSSKANGLMMSVDEE